MLAEAAYLAGPGTWLFSQLVRHGHTLVWGDGEARWSQDDIDRLVSDLRLPAPISSLFFPYRATPPVKALMLVAAEPKFARNVAAFLSATSRSYRDYYFSSHDCRIVYCINHHDEIILSVPDSTMLSEIVANLERLQRVFTNNSRQEQ